MFTNESLNGDFDFDSLEPKPVPFKWKNRNYILREASHAKAIEYRSAALASYQVAQGSYVPGSDLPRTDIKLLTGGVFLQNDNGTEIPVSSKELSEWPYRVTNTLFNRLREISYLTELDLSDPEVLQKEINRLQKILNEITEKNNRAKEIVKERPEGDGQLGNLQGNTTMNSP
jgi:hypothetical protein